MSGVHVGYVLKVYPRLSETFIVNEILELERQGARVTVFSLRPAGEGPHHERLSRVKAEVVYLPELTTHGSVDFVAGHRDALETVRRELGDLLWEECGSQHPVSVKRLAKAAALYLEAGKRGVEHFHSHFGTSSTAVARAASRLSGIPYSFTAHAKDIYLDAHDLDETRRRMRDAAFVVTVCDANRDHLVKLGSGGTPIHRIYNGLDLDEFRPSGATPGARLEILGVGRLVPKKGFDTLIRACAILSRRGVRFRCRIVGDGDEREALERLAREERVESAVSLTGPLPNERVRAEMAAADVVALPARITGDGNRDALPTVLLEALALGRPFVSTPVTGIPEIAGEGTAGRLVEPDRPDELAGELERLATDPGLWGDLGRAGPARASELFDIRKNVAELHGHFARSAATGKRARPRVTRFRSSPALPAVSR